VSHQHGGTRQSPALCGSGGAGHEPRQALRGALFVSVVVGADPRSGVSLDRATQPEHRLPLHLHPTPQGRVREVQLQRDHRHLGVGRAPPVRLLRHTTTPRRQRCGRIGYDGHVHAASIGPTTDTNPSDRPGAGAAGLAVGVDRADRAQFDRPGRDRPDPSPTTGQSQAVGLAATAPDPVRGAAHQPDRKRRLCEPASRASTGSHPGVGSPIHSTGTRPENDLGDRRDPQPGRRPHRCGPHNPRPRADRKTEAGSPRRRLPHAAQGDLPGPRPARPHHRRPHQAVAPQVRATVEHDLARLKDWQILRQCRRRGNAIAQALRSVAYLYNLRRTHHPGLRGNT
jgi:hypothetical protein